MDNMASNDNNSATLFYGRMNPPTKEGHGKGIQKVIEHARDTGSTLYVFVSHSHDNKKNPISPETKVAAIKHSFPKADVQSTSKEMPTIIDIAKHLNEKHKELHVFAGSDRVEEYHNLLHKYNNKNYNYKKIVVHSIGQRDPDGEDSSGSITSGTAARKAALNDTQKFHSGVLGSKEHRNSMIRQIQQASVSKDNKALREQFINNEIFNLHDFVKNKEGQHGEIVYKGSNYVTIQLSDNQTVKSWIYEIQESVYKEIQSTVNIAIQSKNNNYNFNLKRLRETKIPALLIPKNHILEENGILIYQDYVAKNLDICPEAQKLLTKIKARTDLNPKYVKQAIMALDKMFAIEKEASVKKSASSEVIHDFSMYASIAHDTLNLLGYDDKNITFIQDHYVRFSRLIGHHDYSIGDEPSSHIVTGHVGELDEWVDPDQEKFIKTGRAAPGMFKKITSADYQTRVSSSGKRYKVKKDIISKGHRSTDKPDNYGKEMKTRKESYETPIKNTTFDPTKPETKTGVLPFGEYLKIAQVVPVKRPPIEGDTSTIAATNNTKSSHAKTTSKKIQMGLD